MVKRPLISRSSLPRPLQDLAHDTLCYTYNPSNMIPSCRRPSRDRLTMSYNILHEIWYDIMRTLQNPDQKVVPTDVIRLNLTPFAPSADLPHSRPMNLPIQTYMKCIRRAIPYRNLFRSFPETISFEINYSQYNPFCIQYNKNLFPKKKHSNELGGSVFHIFCLWWM